MEWLKVIIVADTEWVKKDEADLEIARLNKQISDLAKQCSRRTYQVGALRDILKNCNSKVRKLKTSLEKSDIAYNLQRQDCVNLTEKVIPNLKSDFRGIVYQLKTAAQANHWDTFDEVVAGVLGYE